MTDPNRASEDRAASRDAPPRASRDAPPRASRDAAPRVSRALALLPNALTVARIAALVPAAVLVLLPGPAAAAAAVIVFVAASATDWLDGWLARRLAVVSAFGRLIDPIADKLLVAAVLFALVADGRLAGLHVAAAIIIVGRELLVSGLREYLAAIGAGGLAVTGPAKWKTAAQMVGLTALLAVPLAPAAGGLHAAGLAALWVATALTVWTGWVYAAAAGRAIAATGRNGGA